MLLQRFVWLLCFLLSGGLVGAGTAWGQSALISGDRVIVGSLNFCNTTGSSANAYTCNLSPAISLYRLGTRYTFLANAANTGSATLNLNGVGAKTLKKLVGGVTTNLTAGDIQPSQMVEVIYDGTNMQMVSQLGNPQVQTFTIYVGSDDAAAALANADLGPQHDLYTMPRAGSVQEVQVTADAGTPSVIVHRRTGSTDTNLLSGALATAASGGVACSKTSAVAGLRGATCSATLQNTSFAQGDTIGLTSGTAGGTAKRMAITIVYTLN